MPNRKLVPEADLSVLNRLVANWITSSAECLRLCEELRPAPNRGAISPARVETLSREWLRPREPTCFDIPHWGLAKEAFVLAIELTRTLVPDFERGAGCIEPLN